MSEYNATIWKLSIFCRFYGRIIPVKEDANGYMRKFHTTTRNEDIDDLYVSFNANMKPMTFMQIIKSKDLYVIGHGQAEENYCGSVFYSKYTLYTQEQIQQLLGKTIKFVGIYSWGTLLDLDQAVIINMDDYLE